MRKKSPDDKTPTFYQQRILNILRNSPTSLKDISQVINSPESSVKVLISRLRRKGFNIKCPIGPSKIESPIYTLIQENGEVPMSPPFKQPGYVIETAKTIRNGLYSWMNDGMKGIVPYGTSIPDTIGLLLSHIAFLENQIKDSSEDHSENNQNRKEPLDLQKWWNELNPEILPKESEFIKWDRSRRDFEWLTRGDIFSKILAVSSMIPEGYDWTISSRGEASIYKSENGRRVFFDGFGIEPSHALARAILEYHKYINLNKERKV